MSGRAAHGVRGARKPAITTPIPLHEQAASKRWASKQDHGASSLERFVESCHDGEEKEKRKYVAAYVDWHSKQEIAPRPSSGSLLAMFGRVGLEQRKPNIFVQTMKAMEQRRRGVPVGEWKLDVTHHEPSAERKRSRHECPNARACPECGQQSCKTVINRDRQCASCVFAQVFNDVKCECEDDNEPMPDARRQRRR